VSRRGRQLSAALAGLVILLFAGRWTAGVLADRWWAAELSPAAVGFLTDWHILRLTLDLSGVLIASAWFIGHLLLVYRAVGSVQVRRNVANLEFREALTPATLLAVAVGSGALLGLLVGTGTSKWWQEVALGWNGVAYGLGDPLLRHDLGLYVAQLPLWRAAHGSSLLLVLLALGVVFALYMLVGAVRWIESRPAINNHARAHLGWLLVALALVLLWGYLLEPYELVAGLTESADAASWQSTMAVAPVLAGVALATAGLSAAWAIRPRHALVAAGWIVLAIGSLIGHLMVPPAMRGEAEPAVSPRVKEGLTRVAFRLGALQESRLRLSDEPSRPRLPSLWDSSVIARVIAGDSADLVAADPAIITLAGRHPVWLAVRALPGSRLGAFAVADDRLGRGGTPLFYAADSAPRPLLVPMVELEADAYQPRAPFYRVTTGDQGVPVKGWARRLLLAWALQAGPLLAQLPRDARVDWRLSPNERVERLAPFAHWAPPVPRVVNGELLWLLDGYLSSNSFPLTDRLSWQGKRVGALQAGFLGVVEAASGRTRIFLRPAADDLAESWAAIARGVVEPASAIPAAVLAVVPYPAELLRMQARAVEAGPWAPGTPPGGRVLQGGIDPIRISLTWAADTTGPWLVVGYERSIERRTSALLLGGREDGQDVVRLVRLDSASSPPTRSALESKWNRFASYDALSDSVREAGDTLRPGPLRFEIGAGGAVAYQVSYARRRQAGVTVAWVSVAAGERAGAGRTLEEAWSNLRGMSVPTIASSAQATRLDEARRWLERADSALRGGDWSGFGRAWQRLRATLGLPADTSGS
jgi:hypothetical protein